MASVCEWLNQTVMGLDPILSDRTSDVVVSQSVSLWRSFSSQRWLSSSHQLKQALTSHEPRTEERRISSQTHFIILPMEYNLILSLESTESLRELQGSMPAEVRFSEAGESRCARGTSPMTTEDST